MLGSLAGENWKTVLSVGGSTEEVAMSSAGQRDEESNLKSGLGKKWKIGRKESRNEDGGEFDQGFEGKYKDVCQENHYMILSVKLSTCSQK